MTVTNLNKMTSEEFRDILEEIVGEMSVGAILAYGGVYSALAEALKNEVIERWEERQPPSPPELPDLSVYNIQPTWEEDADGYVLVLPLDVSTSEQHLDYLLMADYAGFRESIESIGYLLEYHFQDGMWPGNESGVEEPARFKEFQEILELAAKNDWEAVTVTDSKVKEYLGE